MSDCECGWETLYSIFDTARELGGISPWTLRKHVSQGTVQATRLGRRVFLRGEEIERIRVEGLPPLGANAGSSRGRERQHRTDDANSTEAAGGGQCPSS